MADDTSKQLSLFKSLNIEYDDSKTWEKEWKGMPEFIRFDERPYQQIIISFKTKDAVKKFAELIGQTITDKTDALWYPQFKTPTGVFVNTNEEDKK